MTSYPCANTRCTNTTREPNTLCEDCQRREREATEWIARVVRDAEKEERARKIRQDNKHRKDEQE